MNEPAIGVHAEIRQESGRWVVYLCSGFWAPHKDPPIESVVRRIADYPSKRQAEVAARWMERGADRQFPSIEE